MAKKAIVNHSEVDAPSSMIGEPQRAGSQSKLLCKVEGQHVLPLCCWRLLHMIMPSASFVVGCSIEHPQTSW